MPHEAELSHRVNKSAALPYVSNLSPTTTDPCYIPGAKNILTSTTGWSERRPGFSQTVEPTPTLMANLQRVFTWDRTDNSYYVMFSNVVGSTSQVYKMQVGTDASAVLIYTDTGSSTPFDYVVSNNTVYFSNGHVAQKWTPDQGVTNWGIAIGSVNNALGPNTAGNGANDGSFGIAWTNPNNVTSAVSYATASLPSFNNSQNDGATQFGFAIPAINTISGIKITIDVISTNPNANFTLFLLKAGFAVGASKTISPGTTSPITLTFGGTADLWGTTWTPNDINQTNWGVGISATAASLSANVSIRHVQATIYGLGGPNVTVSGSAGTFTATVGYQYVFCYGNSNTGHVSSPTPASASTGAFTNKLNVAVALTASTDPQVNQIRVFRSTDSVATGTTAQSYFEIPTSPYPNTSGNITDNAADTALLVANVAPTATFNDPPTPGISPAYFAGRIWMINGNKVWFSGLEETLLGVPEESWPSGIAGNFWSFDQPPQALAVAGSGADQRLIVFCGGRIYSITGFTLDTFQRSSVSKRRGCRSRTCVSELGGMVAWLDSANQIWATDGTSLQEIGLQIRPDLQNLTLSQCSMSFHAAGTAHWLLFGDGNNIFPYDIDLQQWMPPWTVRNRYIFSGETSAGNYQLMISSIQGAVSPNYVALQLGGTVNTNQPSLAGNGSNGGGLSPAWVAPANVSSTSAFASVTLTPGGISQNLIVDHFTFSFQTFYTILGIKIQVDAIATNPCILTAYLTKNGSIVGTAKTITQPTSLTTLTFGSATDLWGTAWTPNDVDASFGLILTSACQVGAAVASVQNVNATVYAISTGHHDDGTVYTPVWQTQNISMVPDFGNRFSYIAAGLYDEPSRTGMPWYFQVDSNTIIPSSVSMLIDDDPLNSAANYLDITNQVTTVEKAFNRSNGTYLKQNVYAMTKPYSRFISWKFTGPTADDNMRVYGFFTAYQVKK